MLRFTLLGGLQIERDGRPLQGLASRKALALLAYLAVTGREHSREALAGLLWGDSPQERASADLRVVLTSLRRELPAALHITRQTVALQPDDPRWIDARELERAVNDEALDLEALEQALALYRGPFLEGFHLHGAPAFEEWVLVEQERFLNLARRGLRRLVQRRAARGEYAAAIASAQRLLALDPWHEEAHRELMGLLALSGERAAALAQYEVCRRMLAAELGLEPLEETTALYEQIRDAPAALAPAGIAGTLWGPTGPPFVGRPEEHACLIRCWESARRGRGRLTLVAGEAGVGKTRLVEEVLRYAAARGASVLCGHCYEFEAGLPYQAVAQALRQALITSPLPRPQQPTAGWLGELARLLPEVRERYPDLPFPAVADDDETARQRLFEAVARFLTCSGCPTVLFLDDLHWADPATLDLLHYLVRRTAGEALWIVGAYRSEEVAADHPLERLRRGLGRDRLVEHLLLSPLGTAAVRELADTLVGQDEGAALAGFLYRESAGNPLFLVETVEALWDEGLLRERAGALHWAGPPEDAAIPRTIQDVVLQRVERLSRPARRLLGLAAAVGRPFDRPLLEAAAGEDVAPALDEWLRRRLVQPIPTAQLDFTHDKIRAVVYQALPPSQRQAFHRQLGEALERTAGEGAPYGELAQHFEQAGLLARALHYLPLAAAQARAVYAHQEALDYYARALALAQGRPERWPLEVERMRTLHFLGRYQEAAAVGAELWQAWGEGQVEALLAAQSARELSAIETARRDYEAARAWAQEAERLTATEDNPDALREQARARQSLAAVEQEQGHLERAQHLFQEALTLHEQLDDPDGKAACLKGLGQVFSRWGRYEESRQHLEQALPIFRRLDNRQEEATCLRLIGIAWWRQGQYETARQAYTESLSICRAIGDRAGEAAALNGLGLAAIARDDLAETRRCWEESVALYRTLGLEKRVAAGLHNLGILHTGAGEYEQARRCLEESLALDRESGARASVALDLGWLGRLHLLLGEHEAAQRCLDEALALDREIGGGEEETEHLAWRGTVAYETGDWAAAQAYLEQAFAIARQKGRSPGSTESCLLALLHLAQGDASAALDLVRPLLPADKEQHEGSIYAVLGTIHGSGRPGTEDPIPYFERALVLLRGKDDRGYAVALRRYGAWLLQHGAPEEGRRHLQEAQAILERLGAQGERAKVARLLAGEDSAILRY